MDPAQIALAQPPPLLLTRSYDQQRCGNALVTAHVFRIKSSVFQPGNVTNCITEIRTNRDRITGVLLLHTVCGFHRGKACMVLLKKQEWAVPISA